MRIVTVSVFIAMGLAMVVLELLARFSALPVPRLGDLLTWTLRRRSTRIGMVMAWWWIGWHFLGSWE